MRNGLVYLDLIRPRTVSITPKSTYPYWLNFFDAFGKWGMLYGMESGSTGCLIDTLCQHQKQYGQVATFEWVDITRIKTDAGSVFTSPEFVEHSADE